MLKVSIYNSKSSLLGKGSKVLLAYAMVPVCALRNGFRSLPLRSPLGCPIEACTLFVHLAADPINLAPPPQPASRAADAPCAGLGPGAAASSAAGWPRNSESAMREAWGAVRTSPPPAFPTAMLPGYHPCM